MQGEVVNDQEEMVGQIEGDEEEESGAPGGVGEEVENQRVAESHG